MFYLRLGFRHLDLRLIFGLADLVIYCPNFDEQFVVARDSGIVCCFLFCFGAMIFDLPPLPRVPTGAVLKKKAGGFAKPVLGFPLAEVLIF